MVVAAAWCRVRFGSSYKRYSLCWATITLHQHKIILSVSIKWWKGCVAIKESSEILKEKKKKRNVLKLMECIHWSHTLLEKKKWTISLNCHRRKRLSWLQTQITHSNKKLQICERLKEMETFDRKRTQWQI